MTSLPRCGKIPEGSVSEIYAKCVTFTLVRPARKAEAIASTTPWQGDPRINIQNHKGMAKAYQVRQVLKAIARLESQNDADE